MNVRPVCAMMNIGWRHRCYLRVMMIEWGSVLDIVRVETNDMPVSIFIMEIGDVGYLQKCMML